MHKSSKSSHYAKPHLAHLFHRLNGVAMTEVVSGRNNIHHFERNDMFRSTMRLFALDLSSQLQSNAIEICIFATTNNSYFIYTDDARIIRAH